MRVKAIVSDWIVLLILMFGISFAFNKIENVESNMRIAAFIFVFVLYDPLFTSLFGGTIGHKMNGLCVKRASNHEKNILFPIAVLRFLGKSALGTISLLTAPGNQEGRAIHDLIAGSIVLYEHKS